MADVKKGLFTFRFAAVCFALSAAWEAWGLRGPVPLFGHMVGGGGAIAYHIAYVVLFAWLGYSLWVGARSGYYALMGTAALYAADRLQLLFAGDGLRHLVHEQIVQMEAQLQQAMDQLQFAFSSNDLALVREQVMQNEAQLQAAVVQLLTVTIVLFLLGWAGFVVYAYYRRAYFGIGPQPRQS